jgi:hypothetical protein
MPNNLPCFSWRAEQCLLAAQAPGVSVARHAAVVLLQNVCQLAHSWLTKTQAAQTEARTRLCWCARCSASVLWAANCLKSVDQSGPEPSSSITRLHSCCLVGRCLFFPSVPRSWVARSDLYPNQYARTRMQPTNTSATLFRHGWAAGKACESSAVPCKNFLPHSLALLCQFRVSTWLCLAERLAVDTTTQLPPMQASINCWVCKSEHLYQ